MGMANDLLRIIMDNMTDGVYFVDRERRITFWNNAAQRITGYKGEEVIGHSCHENLLNHVDKEGKPLCTMSCPLHATMADGASRMADVLLRHKNGHRIPVRVRTIPAYKDGNVIGGVEIFALKAALQYEDDFVETLTDIAMRDPLTGLPNRAYLQNLIAYKLHESAWLGKDCCIAVADLDDFRMFNNYYHQSTGDIALQSIAASLKTNVGEKDVIGRWNDDEFVGIFELPSHVAPHEIAEKIRILVARSGVMYGSKYLSVSASVGLSVVQRGETMESALSRAQNLMYQSKQKGKNCVSIFAPSTGAPRNMPIMTQANG